MLHQYQAQNEAMQILGTSEPEILELSPDTEDLPTSTAVNPMLDAQYKLV